MSDLRKRIDPGAALKRLTAGETKTVVIDLETSGLDWKKCYPVGWVLTFGPSLDDSYYIPIRHAGGSNISGGWEWPHPHAPMPDRILPMSPFEIDVAKALKRPDLRVVGHNLSFDLKFMARVGVFVGGTCECTMVNQALLSEFMGSYSLASCCRYMKVEEKKGEELYAYLAQQFGGDAGPKQMGNFWRTAGDNHLVLDYSLGDGISTWQLWEAQARALQREGLEKVHGVECRVVKVLQRMTWRGTRVDEDRLARVITWTEKQLETAKRALPKDMNVKSGPQMLRYFNDNGVKAEDLPKTEKGTPSFTAGWLKGHPLGRPIVAVREYGHLLDSFAYPMRDRHLWRGRVHAEYNQSRSDDFGTVTGRLSSNNPNLQQVPKRNKELGRVFRSIFVPDEGMEWGSVDYSQCEPRLLAHYSECKVLLDGYNATPPMDAHSAVAIAAKIDRERGKRINQTLITGGGIRRIAAELNISEIEAKIMMDEYFFRMPEIKELQKTAAYRMEARGYVLSLLGRKARLEDRRFAYRAVNRLLQCGNADILKLKMAEIDEEFSLWPGVIDLLNNVHDSLDYQYQLTAKGRELYEWAKERMCAFGPGELIQIPKVPMVVDAGEGPNWAVATWGPELELEDI